MLTTDLLVKQMLSAFLEKLLYFFKYKIFIAIVIENYKQNELLDYALKRITISCNKI